MSSIPSLRLFRLWRAHRPRGATDAEGAVQNTDVVTVIIWFFGCVIHALTHNGYSLSVYTR
jgi:hypothetical protein